MATKIAWTDKTWNPVTGCTKISPGCQNCYAERMAMRLAGRFGYDTKKPFKVTSHEGKYEEPFGWGKPCMVFTCSMGDLFHPDVPIGCQLGVYETISDDRAQHHTFQILTKRPEMMEDFHRAEVVGALPNLWLGVTAENQEWADKRIPVLLQIPAAVRFVSVEPCIGPVGLEWIDLDKSHGISPLRGWTCVYDRHGYRTVDGTGQPKLDWVIIGCESGPKRRPCPMVWVRDIVEQCHAANIPAFVKQVDIDGQVIHDAEAIAAHLGYSVEDIRQFPKVSQP